MKTTKRNSIQREAFCELALKLQKVPGQYVDVSQIAIDCYKGKLSIITSVLNACGLIRFHKNTHIYVYAEITDFSAKDFDQLHRLFHQQVLVNENGIQRPMRLYEHVKLGSVQMLFKKKGIHVPDMIQRVTNNARNFKKAPVSKISIPATSQLTKVAKMVRGKTKNSVAEIAYQLWLDEGCPHGKDKIHWEQAENIHKNI